jgi:hypothetical protein
MSDAALSESRAAALEDSAHSDAMNPAASETGRGGPADVESSHRASSMEGPDASKAWSHGRADVDSRGSAKPIQTTAASKTWRSCGTDVSNSDASAVESFGPANATKTITASKAGRDRRADVRNSGAVKLMKIPAPEAAVESAAGKTRRDGRRAGVEIRRGGKAPSTKARQAWAAAEGRSVGAAVKALERNAQAAGLRAGINRVRRLGMRNDDPVAVMSPERRDDDGRTGAIRTAVPLIAARIIAGAVPAVVVPAIATVLNRLPGR